IRIPPRPQYRRSQHQHPLMNINPRYSVSHMHLLAGTERAPQNTLLRVSGYRLVQANATMPTYSLNTARAGSTNSSASTAPLARPDLYRSQASDSVASG